MRATIVLLGALVMCACSAASSFGASALIKAPVEQQCSGYGLKGCPDLVDGVLLYVDGDEPAATQKIRRATAQNTPEQVKAFAKAIAVALPSESSAGIVAMLTGESASTTANGGSSEQAVADDAEAALSTASPPEPRTLARVEHVQLALAAQSDPARLTTDSVAPYTDPDRATCEVAGSDGLCVRLLSGPLVVTDAMTPPGCTAELVIGAVDSAGRLAWHVPSNAPGFHGARFFVRSNQWLTVAARNAAMPEGDKRCFVTWAAFRPRIVPPSL